MTQPYTINIYGKDIRTNIVAWPLQCWILFQVSVSEISVLFQCFARIFSTVLSGTIWLNHPCTGLCYYASTPKKNRHIWFRRINWLYQLPKHKTQMRGIYSMLIYSSVKLQYKLSFNVRVLYTNWLLDTEIHASTKYFKQQFCFVFPWVLKKTTFWIGLFLTALNIKRDKPSTLY